MRIEIGSVCEKGPHAGFVTDDDYWTCGGHTMGQVFVEFDDYTSTQQAADALYALISDLSTMPNFTDKNLAREYVTRALEASA